MSSNDFLHFLRIYALPLLIAGALMGFAIGRGVGKGFARRANIDSQQSPGMEMTPALSQIGQGIRTGFVLTICISK
jgi:hypothetical protein